jgi:hypothetical protein
MSREARKNRVFMSALDVKPWERLRIKKIGRQPGGRGAALTNEEYWSKGQDE